MSPEKTTERILLKLMFDCYLLLNEKAKSCTKLHFVQNNKMNHCPGFSQRRVQQLLSSDLGCRRVFI